MAPKVKVTRQDIVNAAVELVREGGASAINARTIASMLNCSTQPVFSNFASMEDLRCAVREAADALYQSYLMEDMAGGKYPEYKASGMAYVRFAREEKELFKLLFMCDRSNETITEDHEAVRPLLKIIQKNLGIDEDAAFLFHMEAWIYAHGIATMIATSYLNWDDAFISSFLTDAYEGIKSRFCMKR